MANRVKEDLKNEKIIRGLMKLPANRRCINCNNLGPQYVCTNFLTFICTNCSGVHREFTHRVKSVSMAKFTSQEVTALQEGGNERAREIFFKELDPQRNQFPDSSNIDKLRDFIKHAYEERRFTGERRVPMAKSYNEETSDSRRTDSYRGGSRSPPYTERYNESPGYNSSRSSNDGRNPRYSYGERSPTDYRRSPQQRPDEKRVVSERMKPQGGFPSPNYYQSEGSNTQVVVQPVRDYYRRDEGSSPQVVVRPVRDILGDDAPPLRIGEPPKPNGSVKAPLPPISPPLAQVERASSVSSIASVRHEPSFTMQPTVQQPSVQPTKEPPTPASAPAPAPEPIMSLIDFSADPEPPISSPPAPAQQTNSPQTNNTNNSDSSGWAAFDAFATQQPRSQSQNPASQFQNPLDSALAQLSLSGSPVAPVDASPKSLEASLFDAPPPSVAPRTNQPEQSLFGALAPTNQQESLPQPAIPTNVQPQQLNAPTTEAKPGGRKELPQDFFTSLYPPAAQQMPGWPRGPQYSMGYAMQYPAAMVMPTYPQAQPQPVKSANPFDIGNDPAPVQAPTYPTMAPPNMHMNMMNMGAQQGLMRPSSLEGTSPRWMAPPSQYMMQQMPGTIRQQMPNNMFPIMQQGGLGQVNTGFGVMPDPNTQGRYSQPNTPNNSFGTVGGNPFG